MEHVWLPILTLLKPAVPSPSTYFFNLRIAECGRKRTIKRLKLNKENLPLHTGLMHSQPFPKSCVEQ